MSKKTIHTPEVEAYCLESLKASTPMAFVTYTLDYDEGYITRGDISLKVLNEILDNDDAWIEVGDGIIYQVSYPHIDEDYLLLAADALAGDFESASYCINENEEDCTMAGHIYYLAEFDLFPQYQNKGLGKRIADEAIRAAGAKGHPVFIYPSQGSHVEHQSLIKFWTKLHPRARYYEQHNTVYIDYY